MTTNGRKPDKLDKETVRAAAAGRWPEILTRVAGIPAELLDPSREHPCPKCAGDTRFRLIDEAAGAVRCSHCFAEKCGDGFAAVQWMKGVKFGEAKKLIAEFLGLQAATGKGDADPAKDLRWMEWSSALAAWCLRAKGPTTEAALLATGARMARYKDRFTVIAWPIIGESLDIAKPVGWVICKHDGGPLPVWGPKGEVLRHTKYKMTAGSKSGLVGNHAIERIKTPGLVELVWKCEGISDLGAMQAAIPEHLADRHVALSNAAGAGEKRKHRWIAEVLARQTCNILHDADQPGQAGAVELSQTAASQAAEGVVIRNVVLPYPIEETHGKDVRDYFIEGSSYSDLLSIAEQTPPVVLRRNEAGEVDITPTEFPTQEKILKKLQLEVLYEDESGAVRVFSTFLRKSSTIRQVDRVRKETLIQACGAPAKECISSDPDGETSFSVADVREAIALIASSRRAKNDERGVGIWQGIDDEGSETETIVLVGNSEGARWNGDQILRRVTIPRADGLVLDFGADYKDWYGFEPLEKMLAYSANVEWRRTAIARAKEIFSRWRWQHQDIAPTIVTGLVLATWVQTIWEWRPLIAMKGESHTGKSTLFKVLGGDASQNQYGIFGKLAYAPDQSSEAGIRQHIRNTAVTVFLDELEKSRDRERIQQMLRSSTRGGTISKGTGGSQRGVDFTIRHIVWTSATEAGLHKQPDINRYIQFELLAAEKGKANQLRVPDSRELQELGQRLLAIAVRGAIEAKRLAVSLKSTSFEGIDPRTVESYAVPAAMMAVGLGEDDAMAKKILERMLENVDQSEQGRTDQEELLADILMANVHLDGRSGIKTVGQVLESDSLRLDYSARLEAAGVKLLGDGDLFVAPKLVSQHLLKGTAWEGLRIDQILMRLPGAFRKPVKIGGRVARGPVIPAAVVAIGQKDGDQIVAF